MNRKDLASENCYKGFQHLKEQYQNTEIQNVEVSLGEEDKVIRVWVARTFLWLDDGGTLAGLESLESAS